MAQITEDYVSFETAKLLKEKGFDWTTEHKIWYVIEEFSTGCPWNSCTYKVGDKTREYDEKYCISMPTLQMAMKWLREVHKIHIEVNLSFSEDTIKCLPFYYVYILDSKSGNSIINQAARIDGLNPLVDVHNVPRNFNTHEEACEAAIKYCLENLI